MISNSLPIHQHPLYLHLRNSFQHTKTHLSITNLDHPLITTNPRILPLFLKRTAKKLQVIPKKLKRLTLGLHYAQFHPSLLYDTFLKDLQYIEHFKIIFCSDSHFKVHFQFLLKTLKKLRNLQVFEIIITLPRNDWDQKKYMRVLTKTLSKSAPRLKDFKLILKDVYWSLSQLTGEPLLNRWGMERLAYIQNLTLHLSRPAFLNFPTQNEGKFDISSLKRFRKLEFLDIAIFDACSEYFSNPKKFSFDHPKGKYFPNLKHFKWSLLDTRWDEIEGLQLLGQELAKSFRNPVEDFSLKLKQIGPLNHQEIKIWNKSLGSLKRNLNRFHISYKNGELTSKGSESLLSSLSGSKLKRMESFCLEFVDWKGINDGFMMKLGQVMNPKLKYLKIRFEFDQEKPKGFVGVLKNIFGGGEEEGITDEGISRFGENLAKRCADLEFVWLEFTKYAKISDKGIESLCESLSKIEGLRTIWLKFRLCGEVNGKSVKEKFGPNREVKFSLI